MICFVLSVSFFFSRDCSILLSYAAASPDFLLTRVTLASALSCTIVSSPIQPRFVIGSKPVAFCFIDPWRVSLAYQIGTTTHTTHNHTPPRNTATRLHHQPHCHRHHQHPWDGGVVTVAEMVRWWWWMDGSGCAGRCWCGCWWHAGGVCGNGVGVGWQWLYWMVGGGDGVGGVWMVAVSEILVVWVWW